MAENGAEGCMARTNIKDTTTFFDTHKAFITERSFIYTFPNFNPCRKIIRFYSVDNCPFDCFYVDIA